MIGPKNVGYIEFKLYTSNMARMGGENALLSF